MIRDVDKKEESLGLGLEIKSCLGVGLENYEGTWYI